VRPRLLERTRGIIHRGMDTLEQWMTATGGFHWRRPDAGAICLVRYDGGPASDVLAEQLRQEHSVLVVPGSHFGLGPFIRFGRRS
jgi:aspartate/methionine/tyrosine aminotransferase